MMPSESLVGFGLRVVAAEPVLSECGKFPQEFRVAMPHRWDDLCGQPVLVAKPVDPRVQLQQLVFEIIRGQGAPVDRSGDLPELRGEVLGVCLLREPLRLRRHLLRQPRQIKAITIGINRRWLVCIGNVRGGVLGVVHDGFQDYRASVARDVAATVVASGSGSSASCRAARASTTWSRLTLSRSTGPRSGARCTS